MPGELPTEGIDTPTRLQIVREEASEFIVKPISQIVGRFADDRCERVVKRGPRRCSEDLCLHRRFSIRRHGPFSLSQEMRIPACKHGRE